MNLSLNLELSITRFFNFFDDSKLGSKFRAQYNLFFFYFFLNSELGSKIRAQYNLFCQSFDNSKLGSKFRAQYNLFCHFFLNNKLISKFRAQYNILVTHTKSCLNSKFRAQYNYQYNSLELGSLCPISIELGSLCQISIEHSITMTLELSITLDFRTKNTQFLEQSDLPHCNQVLIVVQ